jgi:hypothetical protein
MLFGHKLVRRSPNEAATIERTKLSFTLSLWMPSVPVPPNGSKMQPTPWAFAVPLAKKPPSTQNALGSTAMPQLLIHYTVVAGKNFMNVNAVRSGGPGAAIAPHPPTRKTKMSFGGV